MSSLTSADFHQTHRFKSGILLVSVFTKNTRSTVIDNKKRLLVFEKGTCGNNVSVQRLAVYKTKALGSAFHPKRPCYDIVLNDSNFCGLINGLQTRNKRHSKHVFTPTVTVVTKEASIVLGMIDTDYEQSTKKHDSWYQALKKKLGFGGYWSVELLPTNSASVRNSSILPDDDGGTGTTVTLSVTDSKLCVLEPGEHDDTYVVKEDYSVDSVVYQHLDFAVWNNSRIADLSVTAVKDADSADLRKLRFRITHNETIASDISEVLNKIILPSPIQRAVRQRMAPSYIDIHRPADDSSDSMVGDLRDMSSVYRRPRDDRRTKRRSRDDLDIAMPRARNRCAPPTPGPPRPPRTHHMLNSYDLNALSRTVSVKDAVHFYENFGCVHQTRRRRKPPDVVVDLDEDEEYWSVVFTLREVLRKKTPEPDTLGLPTKLRLKLCLMLMEESIPSWKNLADNIGLTEEAVRMIETLFRWQTSSYVDVVTPTECVLRHWQFVHNRWSAGIHAGLPPAQPCTRPTLTSILETMGRHDLAAMLTAPPPHAPPGCSSRNAYKLTTNAEYVCSSDLKH